VQESFWDELADSYDEEICHSLASDRRGLLRKTIKGLAQGVPLAADFGRGVGRFEPLLSSLAQEVLAVDFSGRSLQVARSQYEHLTNVEFRKVDYQTDDACG